MKLMRMIRVTGTQEGSDGEENTIELFTEGAFYIKNDKYYIVYNESEISGMDGSTTSLKIEKNKRVSMKRFGSSVTKFNFEKDKEYQADYMTAYGNFTVNITTNILDIDIDEKTGKGNIEIDYDLNILGDVKTSNKLKIELM